MAEEPLAIDLPPGVIKGESKIASGNRFVDSDQVRWVNGKAEKIGGWEAITTVAVIGRVRGIRSWGDNDGLQYIGAGTAYGLYVIPNNSFTPKDVTPFQSIVVKTNPIATTNGSPNVTVTYAAHGLVVGQIVNFSGASAVGGLTINGNYAVAEILSINTFRIVAGGNASSTASGGGSVTISIELADGEEDVSSGFGYGVGGYGLGTYGTPRSTSSISRYPRSWALDNFGQLLLANPIDGALYQYNPVQIPEQARASVIATAPTQMTFMFVTSERTVFALGTNSTGDQDKMQMHWSGQGAHDDWDYVADVSTANGRPSRIRRLQVGTRIVAGCDLGSLLNIVWTDAALYVNQFTNDTFIYNTRLVGVNCGLLGPASFATVGGIAYWASNDAFWMYNGAVNKMPNSSDIAEWIFKRLRRYFTVKTIAWHNPRYNEIWFAFVVDGDTEPSLAVVFMLESQRWYTCSIDRTAVTSFRGDNTKPIMAGQDGILYRHDTGLNAAGAALPWRLETSIMEMQGGKTIPTVYGISLDVQRQAGDILVELTAWDRTNADPEVVDNESHAIARTTGVEDFRCTGRYINMALSSDGVDCDFRLGVPKAHLVVNSAGRT